MILSLDVLVSLACSGLQLLWLSGYFSDLMVNNKIEVNGHSYPLHVAVSGVPSLVVAVCTRSPDSAFLLLPLSAANFGGLLCHAASPGLFHLFLAQFLPCRGLRPWFVVVLRGLPCPEGRAFGCGKS